MKKWFFGFSHSTSTGFLGDFKQESSVILEQSISMESHATWRFARLLCNVLLRVKLLQKCKYMQ